MSLALEDFGFKFQKLGILKILIFILCNIQFMMVISAIFGDFWDSRNSYVNYILLRINRSRA